MPDRDAFDDLLGNTDRPVAPRPRFAAGLQKRLLAEFDSTLPLNGDPPAMQPSIPMREHPPAPSAKRPARPIFTMAFEIAAALLLLLGAWQFAAHFFGSPEISPGGANQPGLAAVTLPSIIQPATTVQPAAVIASPTVAAAAGPTGQQPGPAPSGTLRATTVGTGDYSRGGGPAAVLGDTIYRLAEVSNGKAAGGGDAVDPQLEARDLATGATVLWSVPLRAFGGPAVADGRIFIFASESGGTTFRWGLEAYDARDGSFLWRAPMSGLAAYGKFQSPIVANGVVYGAGQDGVAIALDPATGKTIWRSTVAQTTDVVQEASSPEITQGSAGQFAIAGGHLYLFNAHGDLVALNLSDGSLAWSFSVAGRYGPLTNLSLMATNDQVVFSTFATSVAHPGADATSLRSVAGTTGDPLWNVSLHAGAEGVVSMALVDGKVVLGLSLITANGSTPATIPNDIEAYNLSDGSAAWTYKSGDDQLFPSGFAVVGTDVYFIGNQSKLFKLDATKGDVSVVFDNQGARLFSDSPVIVTGKIVLDSGNDPLVILSGNGAAAKS